MMQIDLQMDRRERRAQAPLVSEVGSPAAVKTKALLQAELAPVRQALYRLFGALFLYPSSQKRTRSLCAAARDLARETQLWAAYGVSASLPRMLENLLEQCERTGEHTEGEYIRLFQAKPAAPPYESYYLDPEGQARAWIARQLEGEYAQAGLALSPGLNDLPDHVAVEMEYMSFLCGEEVRAWEAGDDEAAAKMRKMQCAFLDNHLGRWFPQFARRTRDARPTDLYSGLMDVTYVFLRREMDLLQLRPGKHVS